MEIDTKDYKKMGKHSQQKKGKKIEFMNVAESKA